MNALCFRLVCTCLVLLSIPDLARATDPGDDLSQLTPEQEKVAGRMLVFMGQAEDTFWRKVDHLNGRSDAEPLAWDIPANGHYEVRVKRGKVIEKAGVMTVTTTVEKPPFIIGGRWNRFIEVAVHPATPLVGMLHATFSVQISSAGAGNIGATMDMMKTAQPPEDIELMNQRVATVFARHGADRERFRSRGCDKPNEGPWKWHRLGTCSGVSMYGPNLLADEQTFALVSDLYATVLDTYFEILDQRRRQHFTPADVAAQDLMRRRWLEDQLFWDMLARTFVPYEAWSAVNAPPVVRF